MFIVTEPARDQIDRAETKISKAAGPSSQLEQGRARCLLGSAILLRLFAAVPPRPSLGSRGTPRGSGVKPGGGPLPGRYLERQDHRDGRRRHQGRRVAVAQRWPFGAILCVPFCTLLLCLGSARICAVVGANAWLMAEITSPRCKISENVRVWGAFGSSLPSVCDRKVFCSCIRCTRVRGRSERVLHLL